MPMQHWLRNQGTGFRTKNASKKPFAEDSMKSEGGTKWDDFEDDEEPVCGVSGDGNVEHMQLVPLGKGQGRGAKRGGAAFAMRLEISCIVDRNFIRPGVMRSAMQLR
eukprot:11281775-Karenia_brevis.AAC.1